MSYALNMRVIVIIENELSTNEDIRREIELALRQNQAGLTVVELYEVVDSKCLLTNAPCCHKGQSYGQPEWKHTVRNALASWKQRGKVTCSGEKGTKWRWVS